MVVKRVDPLSFAKITGVLYALLGLCFGAIFTLVAAVGAAVSDRLYGGSGLGFLLGIGSVIALPIFYGGLGFLFSLIAAALYNVVAGWVGGVAMEIE
jgi:hypothetical protein